MLVISVRKSRTLLLFNDKFDPGRSRARPVGEVVGDFCLSAIFLVNNLQIREVRRAHHLVFHGRDPAARMGIEIGDVDRYGGRRVHDGLSLDMCAIGRAGITDGCRGLR